MIFREFVMELVAVLNSREGRTEYFQLQSNPRLHAYD